MKMITSKIFPVVIFIENMYILESRTKKCSPPFFYE